MLTKGAAGIVIALALVGLPVAQQALGPDDEQPKPANKPAYASSTVEVFGPGEEVTLLSTSIKTSKPTDLVYQVTAECDIVTEVVTVGNDVSEASASIRLWIELDGEPVMINSEDEGEDQGRVTFCDRIHRQETTQFDDEDATIKQFLATRSANAFNWLSLDVGSDTHTVEVKATLVQEGMGDGMAQGVVGKRTLVVEPMMFAQGTTI